MEKLFIEARKKFKKLNLSILDSLPGKTISLAATVQYIDLIPKVKAYLEEKGKKVETKKGAFYQAHVIGCNPVAFNPKADTLLLLADGKFHAKNNAIILNKEIHVFNNNSIELFSKQDIEKYQKQIKVKQKKFLFHDKIGILVSTKPGQNYKQVQKIKKQIKKLRKEVYIFEANNLSINEFENFPQIKIWVNTACFGLSLDHPCIINIQNIKKFLN